VKRGPDPKLFLILAVAAFAVGGGMSFMAFNSVSAAKENLRKLQADSKDAKTLQKDVAASEASLSESSNTLNHLEKGVQTYAYVPTMLTELEKLGKQSGISVIGVRPLPRQVSPNKAAEGEAPRKKAYDELDIEVKGRGNYRSVMNFVAALEHFPKIVASRTIELSPKNERGEDTSLLDVTISLRAFVFATPDQEPKMKTAMAERINHEG
jgi:Tfp pilus assembly protein PilO